MTTELAISVRHATFAHNVLAELIGAGGNALGALYLIDLKGAEANLRRILTESEGAVEDVDAPVLLLRARTIARAKEAIETMIIVAGRAAPADVAAAAPELDASRDLVEHFAALLADVPVEEIIFLPEMEQSFAVVRRERPGGWDPGPPNPFEFYCPPAAPKFGGLVDLQTGEIIGDSGGST
jgi:hypothetical protein